MNKGPKESQENRTEDSEKSASTGQPDDSDFDLPSGFRRTLSTELVTKQVELRTAMEVSGLIESRTWAPGEVIIRAGDTDRDLFFLTKGVVEISIEKEAKSFILNEIAPPHILGDVAFLSGLPRTATAKAKTEVNLFVLKHEDFLRIFKGTPEWFPPLLSSFVSGIKSLHYRIAELQDKT